MTKSQVEAAAMLVEHASVVMLIVGERKTALGRDVQALIVEALREKADRQAAPQSLD